MTNSFKFKNVNENNWQVIGELTRHTISGSQTKHFAGLTEKTSQSVDLALLTKIDTAGLAWLLTLLEFAKSKKIELSYSQAPTELVKLAQLSHVDTFLSMTTEH